MPIHKTEPNFFMVTLLAVFIFCFAGMPASLHADVSEVVVDEDEDMAAVPLPETYLFTGAAKHSIPIELPPGRHGMAPQLTLKYNSFWKNNWMGVGWKLSESAIRRSTKRGLDYKASHFVHEQDGQQSELVHRNDWGPNYYGNKIEKEFSKYQLAGINQGWKVVSRDGTTFYYGTTENSRQYDPANSSRVYRWCLDRVQDTNGNYTVFKYLKNQGQIYIQRIDYTGNTNAGVSGRYHVKFKLVDRKDIAVSYKSRFAVSTAKRLDRIEIYFDSQLIRKYQFTYEYGTSSGCSRLRKITLFGTDGSSLPSTTLLWKEGGSGTFTYKGFARLGGNNLNFADLNGDGYDDAIARILEVDHWDGGYAWKTTVTTLMNTAQWANSSGEKFIEGTSFATGNGTSINDNSKLAPIGLGDINGDGKADLVTIGKARISNGDGSFGSPISTSTPNKNIYVGDVNGDGLTDVVGDTVVGHYQWDHSITVHLSNGNGTFQQTSSIFQESGSGAGEYPQTPKIKPLHLADINGDGYADLIKEDKKKLWIYLSKGNGSFRAEYNLNLQKELTSVSFGDVNGDSLTDLIVRCNEDRSWNGTKWDSYVYIYLSKGDGGFASPTSIQVASLAYSPPRSMSVGDINGDGRADLLAGKSNYPYGVDTYLAQVGGQFASARHCAPESKDGIYLADINGDGRDDLIDYRVGKLLYFLSDGSNPQPDLLSQIKADTGAKMTITYEPSTVHDNPLLPFTFQLVSAITIDDGMGNVSKTTYDTYKKGSYNYSDREFRGFRTVKQTNPDKSIIEKHYHQDDYRKGNEEQILFMDPDGNVLIDTVLTWQQISASQSWGFVRLNGRRIMYNDNPSVFRQETYYYDMNNGHILTIRKSGDGAEDVVHQSTFINKGDWVWRLSEETLNNSDNETIRQTLFAYESLTGNLESKEQVLTEPGAVQNPITYYDYDNEGYGNIRAITDPRGYITEIIYDSATHSHPETVIYPPTGCETPDGCVNHAVEYKYNYLFGKVADKKDENGNWTYYHYDPFGRLEQVIRPDGGHKAIHYYDEAYPRYVLTQIKESETSSIDTFTYYDGLNRKIESIRYGEDDQTIMTLWHYDKMGRQDRIDGPFFSNGTSYLDRDYLPPNIPYQKTTYDYRGRPTKIVQPLGNSVEGGGLATTHYTYSGFAVTITDPDGCMKKTKKDYLDRIREIIEYTEQGEQHTDYDYNAAGDLTRVTNHLNKTTIIEYDKLGRKVSMTDPDMGYWQYPEYDKNGNLLRQIDAKNQEIQFTYDAMNRVTHKRYNTSDPSVTFTYDDQTIPNGIGRLYSMSNNKSNGSFVARTTYDAYDEQGRVLSVTKSIAGSPRPAYTTNYEYDRSGKIVSMTYPDNYKLHYEYHPKSGLLHQITGPDPERELHAELTHYGPTGKIGQIYYGNGTQTDYFYDSASNRLLSLQSKDTDLNFIQDKSYQYTAAGDIVHISNHLNAVTYTYTYDRLHRLVSETNNGTRDTFAPSILENNYEADTPLHAADNIEFNGINFNYSYDPNGNMTTGPDLTDPLQPATRMITYNANNMPVRIDHTKGSKQTTIEFEYDGNNKRVRKRVNGLNRVTYVGEHYEIRDGLQTKYIFAGNLRIAKITLINRSFYHKDHLGSSIIITKYPNGDARETIEYMPFGSVRTKIGSKFTNYTYTDQEWDSEPKLYNYNARLYDPLVGRFNSADLIQPYPYDPQSLNRYNYCRNNPLLYVDPDGHVFGIGMAIGAVSGAISGMIGGIQSNTSLGAAIAGGVIGGIVGTAVGAGVGLANPGLSGIAASSVVSAITGALGALTGGAAGRGAVAGYTEKDDDGFNYEAGWEAATNRGAMINDAVAGSIGGLFGGLSDVATRGVSQSGRLAKAAVGMSVFPVENSVNMLGNTINSAISSDSPNDEVQNRDTSTMTGYGGGRGFGAGDTGKDSQPGGGGMGGV